MEELVIACFLGARFVVCPFLCEQVELQAISAAARHHMGNDWLKIFNGHTMACTINSLRPGYVTATACTGRLF